MRNLFLFACVCVLFLPKFAFHSASAFVCFAIPYSSSLELLILPLLLMYLLFRLPTIITFENGYHHILILHESFARRPRGGESSTFFVTLELRLPLDPNAVGIFTRRDCIFQLPGRSDHAPGAARFHGAN